MSNPRKSRPTVMRQTPGANLAITEIYADGTFEQVTLVNRGQIDQPLTGWALASLHGLEVFVFPEGTVASPGIPLRVLSGEGARATSPRDLVWTRQSVWNNRSDTALLFDNEGREVARRAHPRPAIREERVPKLKILVEDLDGYHLVDWDDMAPPGRD